MLVSSKSTPGLSAQAEPLDALLDHGRAADQDRLGDAFVDDVLHRAQHGLLLAFGVDDALRIGLRAREHRLHQRGRAEHELR